MKLGGTIGSPVVIDAWDETLHIVYTSNGRKYRALVTAKEYTDD